MSPGNDEQKALTDAVNLLATYAERHLPVWYEIRLAFGSDESRLELIDDLGDEVEVFNDGRCSHFAEACKTARECEELREWEG